MTTDTDDGGETIGVVRLTGQSLDGMRRLDRLRHACVLTQVAEQALMEAQYDAPVREAKRLWREARHVGVTRDRLWQEYAERTSINPRAFQRMADEANQLADAITGDANHK